MELYEKQVKYSLYEWVESYGFNPDGYTDILVEDTGWMSEDEDIWETSGYGPYIDKVERKDWLTNPRYVKKEARYQKVDVELVKYGHWIVGQDGSYMCSECGRVFRYEIGNYCSFCGTRLKYEE